MKKKNKTRRKANSVSLVGEFNDWDTAGIPMKKLKNGSFSTTLNLATDKKYQFRYLLDNKSWENDGAADEYVPSTVSFEENSVVNV